MTLPNNPGNSASEQTVTNPSASENCDYIPHPDGIHEMVIRVSSPETVDAMLAKFNAMYETTRTQDRQLILIFDQTKTGLPLTALFPKLRAWLREHPIHANPRIAVLFGHNNLLGMLGSFLGSIGISPRRIRMWKPTQREEAIAWLLADDAKR